MLTHLACGQLKRYIVPYTRVSFFKTKAASTIINDALYVHSLSHCGLILA